MIDVNRKGEVWVFAEQHNGRLEDTPIELMSKARRLADTLGVELGAAVLGDKVKGLATKLIQCGADKVYVAEHPLLAHYQTNSYAKAMHDLIHKHQPQIVLYGATVTGRDLAPRIASATKAGLTADCTDLQIGDHTTASDKKLHKNLLFQIRPAFGGDIVATIIKLDPWPQLATGRWGARTTSGWCGTWQIVLAVRRRRPGRRLIWAISTTTIRLGRRGQRFAR